MPSHFITTTAELRTYVPVSSTFQIAEIEPQIHDVEQEFIIPIIGQAQFDSLLALPSPSGNNLELIKRCRNAVAKLAMMKWIPFGNINVQSGGFTVTATDNGQVASQWRVDKLEEEMRTEGYNKLQDILTFLWSKDEGTFTDWDESDEKLLHRSFLILTANDFSKYYWIKNSYEVFCLLKPGQTEVMNQYIRPILGDDLYNQLIDQVADDSLSADNITLIDYVKRATAPLTVYESVARMNIDLSHWGITTFENADNGDNTKVRKPAATDKLSYALRKAGDDGRKHLGALRAFLNNNATSTKYALYYDSDLYQDIDDAEDENDSINDTDSGVFIM